MITLKQRAYQYIRDRLMSGEIEAGSRLSDLMLSREIGISRTPVREAISQLESEGLIEQIPRFGAFARRLDRRDVEELYDLRTALESFAVGQIAGRLDDSTLDELRGFCEEMRQVALQVRKGHLNELDDDLSRRWVLADLNFHVTLLRASGNRRIFKIIGDARILTQIFAFKRERGGKGLLSHMAGTYRQHRAILSALRRSDGEAARRWMSMHLQRGKREALERFGRSRSGDRQAESQGLWENIQRLERYTAALAELPRQAAEGRC